MTHPGMSEQDLRQLEDEFVEYLQRSGNRVTVPRKVILRAALQTKEAFDAEELFQRARKIDPIISLTSVYRTLPMLIEAGALVEADQRDKKQLYQIESFGSMQFLLECSKCGNINDYEPGCTRLQLQAHVTRSGFSANSIFVKIRGVCKNCKEGLSQ